MNAKTFTFLLAALGLSASLVHAEPPRPASAPGPAAPAAAPPPPPGAVPAPAPQVVQQPPPGPVQYGYGQQVYYQPQPQPYYYGAPPPPQHYATQRPARRGMGLIISGAVMLSIGYAFALTATSVFLSQPHPDCKFLGIMMAVPVAGPFITSALLPNAPYMSAVGQALRPVAVFFYLFDGVIQAVGATLLTLGIVRSSGNTETATSRTTRRTARVTVLPTLGPTGAGVSLNVVNF